MTWYPIIAIGRQFGSGGREIGQRVAKDLAIPFYDRALVEMASEKMGVDQFELQRVDEKGLMGFLSTYQVPKQPNSVTGYGLTLNDSLYLTQCHIIEALAQQGPCVVIGRTASEVLKKNPKLIDIFICADKEDRVKRISEKYMIPERDAAKSIREVDRKRKYYFENYTDRTWGSPDSHQIILNVSLLGMDRTVELIKAIYLSGQETE